MSKLKDCDCVGGCKPHPSTTDSTELEEKIIHLMGWCFHYGEPCAYEKYDKLDESETATAQQRDLFELLAAHTKSVEQRADLEARIDELERRERDIWFDYDRERHASLKAQLNTTIEEGRS
jgi:ABC-type uncharacterized transport system ATPase subunit